MLKKVLTATCLILGVSYGFAQETQEEEKPKLNVSGSVDAYYRFNFANAKDSGYTNNYTSFTNSSNSFEVGMASLKFDYTTGKVGLVADLGFGTRAAEFSYAESGILASIKQAYVTYSPSDKVTFTMGKWATHVGYELLDPQLNRNYSMSYMFSYGPFSHTGLKADFSLGSGFGAMIGIANPTDMISAPFASKFALAQLSKSGDAFSAYLNYVGGKDAANGSNNQLGLTATGTVSDKFSIGYDGTVKFYKPDGGSSMNWWGSALYLNVDPTEKFGFTVRGEVFGDKDYVAGFGTNIVEGTLSLNLKPAPNFTIIPELRLDAAKDPIFFSNTDTDTPTKKGTASFILAAVYSF